MSKIRIVNGPYRGREKTMAMKPITIGRDAEAGIQILDRSASRFHAEIFPVGGMYFVRDLESKNGTFVNDDKISDEELLREGDVIKIGSTELIHESGTALNDEGSSDRISYREDPDVLSNTLEFRLDELSDIAETKDGGPNQDHSLSLRMLYQIGRLLSGTNHSNEKESKVLELLVHNLPADCALIFRRDGPTGKLIPAALCTAQASAHPVISRSIIKKTFSENKALHIANAQDDERFDRNSSAVQKGVRSVICVPLAVGGQTRGVLYLSRGPKPFDQIDVELISACAIQLGMSQFTYELGKRHSATLWKSVSGMVKILETRMGTTGSGERCARYCLALAGAMALDNSAKERLTHAGLLHHVVLAAGDGGNLDELLAPFEDIDGFDSILPLIRAASPNPSVEPDTESHILTVAAAFETATCADPGADVNEIIESIAANPAFDATVTSKLQGCYLDGSLYNTAVDS
jgi:pSer/pThr/pTyr-binding forkhead associated (FHA) protein